MGIGKWARISPTKNKQGQRQFLRGQMPLADNRAPIRRGAGARRCSDVDRRERHPTRADRPSGAILYDGHVVPAQLKTGARGRASAIIGFLQGTWTAFGGRLQLFKYSIGTVRPIAPKRRVVIVHLLREDIDPDTAAIVLGLSRKSLLALKHRYLRSKLPLMSGTVSASNRNYSSKISVIPC